MIRTHPLSNKPVWILEQIRSNQELTSLACLHQIVVQKERFQKGVDKNAQEIRYRDCMGAQLVIQSVLVAVPCL